MKIITKKSIFCFFIMVTIMFTMLFGAYAAEPDLSALTSKHALVLNIDTGVKLHAVNENEPVFCGFLPRMMTVALMLDSGKNLNDEMTITPDIISKTPQISSANLKKGDTVSLYDLCVAALIANSQEATVALATYLGGDVETFLTTLNAKATELGCTSTNFTNVHGYYRDGNKNTTLSDAATLIKYAVSIGDYLQIANTTYAKITVSGKQRELYTRNSITIKTSDYYIPNIQAIGVSSDSRIGAACAGMMTDNDMRLVSIAVTDKSAGNVFSDIKLLSSFAAEEYTTKTVIEKGAAIDEIPVRLGKGRDSVVLISDGSIDITIPKSTPDDKIEYVYNLPENLTAPVTKGDLCGTLTIQCEGVVFSTVNLLAQTSVEKDIIASFTEALNSFFSNAIVWICLAVIVLFVIIYTIILFYINRGNMKKKKNKNQERVKIDID